MTKVQTHKKERVTLPLPSKKYKNASTNQPEVSIARKIAIGWTGKSRIEYKYKIIPQTIYKVNKNIILF